MSANLNRRDLAAALLAPSALLAQTTAATNDELPAAREQIRANGKLLADFALPMATEPAFQFKA